MNTFLSKTWSHFSSILRPGQRLLEGEQENKIFYEGRIKSVQYLRAYWTLLKPRVMGLVVFTAFCGLLAAENVTGQILHPFLKGITILSIALGAGAAAVLNMWWERDLDALMDRTKNRPLPQGIIRPAEALSFGIFLSVLSIILLGLSTNWMAAGFLTLTIVYYIGFYTIYLKPRTPYNIVIGGVAGAIPPVIGWVANGGGWHSEPLLMFLVIFFWTMPHTWALCLFIYPDYAKANIPMMPAVKGIQETKRQMLLYTVLMVGTSCIGGYIGMYSYFYVIGGIILNSIFLYFQMMVMVSQQKKHAVHLFAYSIIYLFLLFILMIIGRD